MIITDIRDRDGDAQAAQLGPAAGYRQAMRFVIPMMVAAGSQMYVDGGFTAT